MGVFARLLRRSKATEEGTSAAAPTEATSPEPEPAAEAAAAPGAADTGGEQAPPDPEAKEATGSDGVEIPQQQSTGKAADNEAGEGART
ncbi:hypothetical protein [Streptomyces sp. NPDC005876]|jgi:hypothetical protein|uniref:hypothetical protein n=1 Tax=unclassified Streptomyces TaxID=2593676 RepID=UPI00340B7ABF